MPCFTAASSGQPSQRRKHKRRWFWPASSTRALLAALQAGQGAARAHPEGDRGAVAAQEHAAAERPPLWVAAAQHLPHPAAPRLLCLWYPAPGALS